MGTELTQWVSVSVNYGLQSPVVFPGMSCLLLILSGWWLESLQLESGIVAHGGDMAEPSHHPPERDVSRSVVFPSRGAGQFPGKSSHWSIGLSAQHLLIVNRMENGASIQTVPLCWFLPSKRTVTSIEIVINQVPILQVFQTNRFTLKRKINHIHRYMQFFTRNLREPLDLEFFPGPSISLSTQRML